MRSRTGVSLACLVLAAVGGCQSYRPAPFDIAAHRGEFEARAFTVEPVEAFAARLREAGSEVPDKINFDDGLSAAEAEVVALFYNPELRLARMEAGIALATFETAGLWEDPAFGFDGADILSSAAPFEFGFMLSITLPVSGRLAVEKDRAGAAHTVELRRIEDAEWRTRATLRRAWIAWVTAKEQAGVHRDVLSQIEQIVSITNQLEAAGELQRIEGRLFRVELAARRAALINAELAAAEARRDLLSIIGMPPDAAITLVPSVPAVKPDLSPDRLARLINSNTQLSIRRAEYQLAEQSLRLEVRKQYPDISIGSGYGNEDDDRLMLGVSLPVPLLNANRGGIATAHATRARARTVAETTYEHLARALASAQAALDAARIQRTHYTSEILPLLAQQAAEVQRVAELGDVDTLLFLDTVTRQFDAKIYLLDLQFAELEIAITIEQLLGPDWATDPTPIPANPDSPESALLHTESTTPIAAGGYQ
ncbi:MAG: TolC family protein [Planctomycetota bacterium]|nr:TolC family protein [Planctomycetota bacterium]